MKESGIVKKVDNGKAYIEIMPSETCTKCCSCNASKKRLIMIGGEKIKGLNTGDNVMVEIPASSMLKVYALMYILPLAGFLSGVLGGYFFTASPIVSLSAGLALTIVMFFVAGRVTSGKKEFIPDVCPKK